MIDVYKILHGYYDPKGTRSHNKNSSSYGLTWICETLLYLAVRVVSKLNSLPADVVNAPSVDAFNGQVLVNTRSSFQLQSLV